MIYFNISQNIQLPLLLYHSSSKMCLFRPKILCLLLLISIFCLFILSIEAKNGTGKGKSKDQKKREAEYREKMEAKKREKKQRNREKPAMLKKLGKLVPSSLKKLGSKKNRPEQTDEQHQQGKDGSSPAAGGTSSTSANSPAPNAAAYFDISSPNTFTTTSEHSSPKTAQSPSGSPPSTAPSSRSSSPMRMLTKLLTSPLKMFKSKKSKSGSTSSSPQTSPTSASSSSQITGHHSPGKTAPFVADHSSPGTYTTSDGSTPRNGQISSDSDGSRNSSPKAAKISDISSPKIGLKFNEHVAIPKTAPTFAKTSPRIVLAADQSDSGDLSPRSVLSSSSDLNGHSDSSKLPESPDRPESPRVKLDGRNQNELMNLFDSMVLDSGVNNRKTAEIGASEESQEKQEKAKFEQYRQQERAEKNVPVPINEWNLAKNRLKKLQFKQSLLHELRAIQCDRVFAGDSKYLSELANSRAKLPSDAENLIDLEDTELPVNCEAIKVKPRYATDFWKHGCGKDNKESCCFPKFHNNFPLAFVRRVSKDYFLLEAELSANYEPQNWYCFAVDRRADPKFRARLHTMANCFSQNSGHQEENSVMVVELDREDGGDLAGLVKCAEKLEHKQWEYLVNLQNHDIQLKTNVELVQILKWFKGANMIPYRVGQIASKGHGQAMLTHEFVKQFLNKVKEGKVPLEEPAEYVLAQFGSQKEIQVPGGFTPDCALNGIDVPSLMSFQIWMDKQPEQCKSGISHQNMCVFGIEDLAQHFGTSAKSHFLFASKMMSEHDAGALHCWHQKMHQRYMAEGGGWGRDGKMDRDVYMELPQVRYHQKKFDGSEQCKYKYLHGQVGHCLASLATCPYKDIFISQRLSINDFRKESQFWNY